MVQSAKSLLLCELNLQSRADDLRKHSKFMPVVYSDAAWNTNVQIEVSPAPEIFWKDAARSASFLLLVKFCK